MEINTLNRNLESQINQLRQSQENDKLFYSEVIALCKKRLLVHKQKILQEGFVSSKDEIRYFKEIKQVPLQHLIYYTELRFFEFKFPFGFKKGQEKYIHKNLEKINRFFDSQLEFLQYIEFRSSYLDEQYFLRKNLDFLRITHIELYNIDPEFNTSHDLLLAKILAYKKLTKYFEEKLCTLKHSKSQESSKSRLKWTSSKAALTELTYALYHGGAVNNGNTDIREIATALEQIFNFPIGDVYRTYSEIRSRKNRRTKFLDNLSASLISGMDNLDQ